MLEILANTLVWADGSLKESCTYMSNVLAKLLCNIEWKWFGEQHVVHYATYWRHTSAALLVARDQLWGWFISISVYVATNKWSFPISKILCSIAKVNYLGHPTSHKQHLAWREQFEKRAVTYNKQFHNGWLQQPLFYLILLLSALIELLTSNSLSHSHW